MAASFKLPSLVRKRKPPVNFPCFEWREISIKEELGSGTFGSVYLVNYENKKQNVIVKKMKGESAEAKQRFEKEAAILNTHGKGPQKCLPIPEILPRTLRHHDGVLVFRF